LPSRVPHNQTAIALEHSKTVHFKFCCETLILDVSFFFDNTFWGITICSGHHHYVNHENILIQCIFLHLCEMIHSRRSIAIMIDVVWCTCHMIHHAYLLLEKGNWYFCNEANSFLQLCHCQCKNMELFSFKFNQPHDAIRSRRVKVVLGKTRMFFFSCDSSWWEITVLVSRSKEGMDQNGFLLCNCYSNVYHPHRKG
jgi:hypothetical protein